MKSFAPTTAFVLAATSAGVGALPTGNFFFPWRPIPPANVAISASGANGGFNYAGSGANGGSIAISSREEEQSEPTYTLVDIPISSYGGYGPYTAPGPVYTGNGATSGSVGAIGGSNTNGNGANGGSISASGSSSGTVSANGANVGPETYLSATEYGISPNGANGVFDFSIAPARREEETEESPSVWWPYNAPADGPIAANGANGGTNVYGNGANGGSISVNTRDEEFWNPYRAPARGPITANGANGGYNAYGNGANGGTISVNRRDKDFFWPVWSAPAQNGPITATGANGGYNYGGNGANGGTISVSS